MKEMFIISILKSNIGVRLGVMPLTVTFTFWTLVIGVFDIKVS